MCVKPCNFEIIFELFVFCSPLRLINKSLYILSNNLTLSNCSKIKLYSLPLIHLNRVVIAIITLIYASYMTDFAFLCTPTWALFAISILNDIMFICGYHLIEFLIIINYYNNYNLNVLYNRFWYLEVVVVKKRNIKIL